MFSILQCLSDPTHILRNYLAQEGLITIAVSGGENATDSRFYQVHPKIKYYKNGVAQPAVLCVKSDRKVLYQWAVVPQLVSCVSKWSGEDDGMVRGGGDAMAAILPH